MRGCRRRARVVVARQTPPTRSARSRITMSSIPARRASTAAARPPNPAPMIATEGLGPWRAPYNPPGTGVGLPGGGASGTVGGHEAERLRRLRAIGRLREAYAASSSPARTGAERTIRDALDAGLAEGVIHDAVITPAMRRVGDLWSSGELTVADEHLATQITLRMVALLRRASAWRPAARASRPARRPRAGTPLRRARDGGERPRPRLLRGAVPRRRPARRRAAGGGGAPPPLPRRPQRDAGGDGAPHPGRDLRDPRCGPARRD